MVRSEYILLVAAISDRWQAGQWGDRLVESWWPVFAPYDLELGVKVVKALQEEGHGPFSPDPGLVVRRMRAALPGGGRYPVGQHARELQALEETAASKETALAAIQACREWLAHRSTGLEGNESQEATGAP